MSHIAAERKRRREMNERLKVLRSLTPSFYIKRGDQASIIEGVIEFIKELQQVEESLEGKKRSKTTLSPIIPKPIQLDVPPLNLKEVVACCKSPTADIRATISGSNVILRTISRKIPHQIGKIIYVLERYSFQILQLNISSVDEYVLYFFVIQIGLECELSMEELVLEVQRSFPSEEFQVKQI